MPISWLDVILIVIMLISGFLAMVRGFTRESSQLKADATPTTAKTMTGERHATHGRASCVPKSAHGPRLP